MKLQKVLCVLPHSIRRRFNEETALKKISANIGWLTFESLLRMGLGLFVSILLARNLGKHDFGILSYAFSITSLLHSFAYLGLGGIVVRDIVKYPKESGDLMGSCFLLKMTGAILGFTMLVAFAIFGHSSSVETWVLIIIGASLLFQPMGTVDFWFQSITKSKYSVMVKSTAYVLASVGMIVLVITGASLVAFAWVSLTEFVLAAILLLAVYQYTGQSIRSWKIRLPRMIGLFKQSWILMLSSFLALVYLRLDQIMLRWMIGPDEVGVYAVAAKFSRVWYFIPSAIAVSVLPKLTEIRGKDKKKYNELLQCGFDALFAVSVVIAIVMTLIATPTIRLLYGIEYERAGGMLAIHVWAGVFIFMRALLSKWIIMENYLIFSLLSHALGAIANVILNFILIKHYRGYGAAVATLVSYAAASYLGLFIMAKTRPLAFMMSKSLVLPFRVVLSLRQRCRPCSHDS